MQFASLHRIAFAKFLLEILLNIFMWNHEKMKEFRRVLQICFDHQFFGMLCFSQRNCTKLCKHYWKCVVQSPSNAHCTFFECMLNLILFFEFGAVQENAHLILISLTQKPSECQYVKKKTRKIKFFCFASVYKAKWNWMRKSFCLPLFSRFPKQVFRYYIWFAHFHSDNWEHCTQSGL